VQVIQSHSNGNLYGTTRIMVMAEDEFLNIGGDSFRGSRFSNFAGGGVDPQGNVSSARTEDSASAVGTSVDSTGSQQQDAQPQISPSVGLTGQPEEVKTSDIVIGSALPFAGREIGKSIGTAIGAGAPVGEAVKYGASKFASNVSGGLIGSSAPTSAQLLAAPVTKGAGSAAGSAASKSVSAGAGAGVAIGSGFATAAITLLSGGSVKDAAKAGVATAVGTAIGNIILPGIGGFVGGFIGGLFCFVAGVPIIMEDGTKKNVEELNIGDEILHGGKVLACGRALVETLYSYKNTVVSHKHAIFEDGEWIRVEESEHAQLYDGDESIVYPIATAKNIIINPWYISADVLEAPEHHVDGMTYPEIINHLNMQTERNDVLLQIEKEVCGHA